MATHTIHDIIASWTPHFNHRKAPFDLYRVIRQSPHPNLFASTLAFVMLRHLAQKGNNLEFMLTTERSGGGPNVEGLLKQILAMKGIYLNYDILYGISIPPDVRQHWQDIGIDPNSENEVFEYLSQKNVKFLSPNDDVRRTAQKLQEYAQEHNLIPAAISENTLNSSKPNIR
jgi:hypothetical protein